MNKKPKILVVGDVMLDSYVEGEVVRISPEAPVPILKVTDQSWTLGGAANVAQNLINLGADTYIVGYIGKDAAGIILKDIISKKKMKSKIIELKEVKTTYKKRFGYPQMLRVDVETPGLIDAYRNDAEVINYIKKVTPDIVIVSDYAKGCISQSLFDKIIKLNKKIKVFVDPKPNSGVNYKGCYLMSPNLKEAEEMLPKHKIKLRPRFNLELAEGIKKKYDCNALITLGEEGLYLSKKGDKKGYHELSQAKEVYNVSGAGDAVIAAMAFVVAKGWSLENAMRFANKVAGNVVSTKSTAISKNEKVVFTNGCFDILHPGHIDYLEKASRLGYLIVGINSDASMKRIKRTPVFNQDERASIIRALKFVDKVEIFEEDTPARLIEEINPDIYAKGGDYKSIKDIDAPLRKLVKGKLHIVPKVNDHSSSKVLKLS